jgi:IclR family pca regulon transcriptional regulator
VAAVTELSPAVARRCLNTLVDLGYVGRKGKLFLLTPEVMGFASAFLESMNLEEVVRPYLQEVRDSTGDSSSLAVLSHFDILYLVHVSTNRMVRLVAGFGTRFPAYPTSLGRVLLAHQAEQHIDKYLAEVKMHKLTDKTLTSVTQLRRILNRCRRDGYASIQDELDYGIVSVSVPVFGTDGRILAAINCSTATTRVNQAEMVGTRLPRLRAAAKSIEIELRRYPILVHSIKSVSFMAFSRVSCAHSVIFPPPAAIRRQPLSPSSADCASVIRETGRNRRHSNRVRTGARSPARPDGHRS